MKLKEIREMYPEGTQIVLTEMAGESQMPYGLKGTVKFVDDAGHNAEFSIMLLFIKKPPAFNNF